MSKKREATFHGITPEEEIRLQEHASDLCGGGYICPDAARCLKNNRCIPEVPRPEPHPATKDPGGRALVQNILDRKASTELYKPERYTQGLPDGVEARDILNAHVTKGGGTYDTAAALKYIIRHNFKGNPRQDIEKAKISLERWLEDNPA
jgi:hypothetical protein